MRKRGTLFVLACPLLACLLCTSARGQLTIHDPGMGSTAIRQTSLTTPAKIMSERMAASNQAQIRVKVQYLMVDTETRAAIFAEIDPTKIATSTDLPKSVPSAPLEELSETNSTTQSIRAPSRVTTCLLDDSTIAAAIEIARQSARSDVSNAPSVILLDGKEAEMNDLVQHPFVMDLERQADLIKPAVHSMDDGTRMRLLARVPETEQSSPMIDLTCEIAISRLLEVRTDELFGLSDEPYSVQVPVHQVTTSVARERLSQRQTLLIDTHVTQDKRIESQEGVPMIGKIPYVGRSFKNVSVEDVKQHIIVLLKPTIEKSPRP